MPKFRVKVEVHKYVDLSDRPTERFFPIEADDEDDAVYRMRDMLEKERVEWARMHGVDDHEGVAMFKTKDEGKRYLGRVLLGHALKVGP